MLPFTREQFPGVFADRNTAVRPVQGVACVLGLAVVAALLRPSPPGHGWSIVGGSAAFMPGVPQDWPLLFSGLTIVLLVWRDRRRAEVPEAAQAEVLECQCRWAWCASGTWACACCSGSCRCRWLCSPSGMGSCTWS